LNNSTSGSTLSRLNQFASRFGRRTLIGVVLGCLVVLVVAVTFAWQGLDDPRTDLVFYEVARSDLPIVVTERGYLESQEQTIIECQVATYDRNSGTSSINILSIVPNGSVVEKGDLLVELDDTAIRDRLESEMLEFQSDKSNMMQAEARKKNQITQNETSIAEAELALKLARLDRQMYIDEISGSFKLAVEEIERQIDDTRNTILEAQAALKLQETEKAGIEELFRLGYKGKSDLDQSRFAFMKAEAALAAAVNRLSNHEATRRQLKTYEYQKELLRLDGEVATAERSLRQVQVNNESELAQVDAQLFEAQERVARQRSRIQQLETQLKNCKIYAPNSGMVVYAQEPGQVIAEGATVRQRQELLRLPNLAKMQVRTLIHEAVLDQVRPGLPVSVRVDAFPNRAYRGVVDEVAVVPSRNDSTSAKTYDCVVVIPENVEQLKPGMTAVAEINVDRLQDVLAVPVQAIVQVDQETWCYANRNGALQKTFLELGRNNDKFVHVASGLETGDQVVLNPMTLYQQESGGNSGISPDNGAEKGPPDSELDRPESDAPTESVTDALTDDPDASTQADNRERPPAAERSGRRKRSSSGPRDNPGGRSGDRREQSTPPADDTATSAWTGLLNQVVRP
jgi:HlyD family secretion protein